MISPYAVRLLIVALDSSGLSAGRLYFVSTLGSAAGTLITSFYLVLYLEIHTILLCLMAISASIGLTLIVLDRLPAQSCKGRHNDASLCSYAGAGATGSASQRHARRQVCATTHHLPRKISVPQYLGGRKR
jgi:hypothetical protein